MCADHDVAIGGVGPHRHPTALVIHLQKGGNHLRHSVGLSQQQQWVLGSEGVPERIVVVRDAVVYTIVKGAVIASVLREGSGK